MKKIQDIIWIWIGIIYWIVAFGIGYILSTIQINANLMFIYGACSFLIFVGIVFSADHNLRKGEK